MVHKALMSSGLVSRAGKTFGFETCLDERDEEIPKYSDAGTKAPIRVFLAHVRT